MKNVYSALALLFVGAFIGYFISQYAGDWSEVSRDPAAVSVQWNYDYSNLSGENLQTAMRQRLISQMVIQKTPSGSGLALGHFEFLNSKGEKKFACNEYQNIIMVFAAEGSMANKIPKMEVTGRCHYSDDRTMILPIIIPVSTIQTEKAEDGEFIFKDNDNLYIKFQNLNETWPTQWTLKSLQLVGDDNLSPLIISEPEIKRVLGSLPTLSW